jgi:hypothetical protein
MIQCIVSRPYVSIYRMIWANKDQPERSDCCTVTIDRSGVERVSDQQAAETLIRAAEQLSGVEYVRKE